MFDFSKILEPLKPAAQQAKQEIIHELKVTRYAILYAIFDAKNWGRDKASDAVQHALDQANQAVK